MTTTWRLRTCHGTLVGADRFTGDVCHFQEGPPLDIAEVRAISAAEDADWLLLTADRTLACPGEALPAAVLSYDRIGSAAGASLRHPSTGCFMSALPGGGMVADRPSCGGWEVFSLTQIEGRAAEHARFGFAAGHGRPDAELLARHSRHLQADPAALAAMLRLLAPGEFRKSVAHFSRLDVYEKVFPALRQHVSGHEGRFEWTTADRLREGMERYGWQIGDHSYGAPEVIDGQHGMLTIGRYCSIAGQVQIVVANHPTRAATTYPFANLHRFWPSADPATPDHFGDGVVIGHNVWIGVGACLLPGARVGDGAIIGARAVVAGEVPAFAVVVGNPARVIRRRFDDMTILRLLRLRWWDWPDHIVDSFVPLLLSDDVEVFLQAGESELRRSAWSTL